MNMYGRLENGFFEIEAGHLTYWNTKREKVFSGKLDEAPADVLNELLKCKKVFSGKLDEAPADVLNELLERGAIKRKA